MKKQTIKTLSLTKTTVSRINELNEIVGGTGTMSTDPGCASGDDTVSAVILCMEDFTQGCSPSFLRQCPYTKDTDPQYCW
ncbi:hypothetical protein KORDIASMS9_04453 [Kordia sp. SMS9]|uniref:hypothetical protein n=1 Tax=Kordia sp. SMS9 TaxID=2282170 RepID=UPI000E0DAE79|nr:hypothetical protein [Kordia sp. SMS9]AXG72185.1 hypothetical protein KORDIASMS9_04453 [Kordia sp. SMS9]